HDFGAWHIVVLNSNSAYVATGAGSAQEQWLKADLAATTQHCLLPLWHRPRLYSNTDAVFYATSAVKAVCDDLYAAGAGLTLNAPPPPPPRSNQPRGANPGGPYASGVADTVHCDGSKSCEPDSNTPHTYTWTFGDNSTGTGPTPLHAYNAAGTDTVTLVVTDA